MEVQEPKYGRHPHISALPAKSTLGHMAVKSRKNEVIVNFSSSSTRLLGKFCLYYCSFQGSLIRNTDLKCTYYVILLSFGLFRVSRQSRNIVINVTHMTKSCKITKLIR